MLRCPHVEISVIADARVADVIVGLGTVRYEYCIEVIGYQNTKDMIVVPALFLFFDWLY